MASFLQRGTWLRLVGRDCPRGQRGHAVPALARLSLAGKCRSAPVSGRVD
jgi:hypothetical protein